MTPQQLEDLEYLINDPDWDMSQRNDAWELLQVMRSELAARNAPQAELTAAVVEAAHKLIAYRERQSATSFQLEKMDDYIRELDKTLAALASGAESEVMK